jgi:Tfp pilus assembly protein PilO
MWLQSIVKIPASTWLLSKNSKLRAVALVTAGLVCANLLLYVFLVAPWARQLSAGESAVVELKKRQAEAVSFQRQKPLFAGVSAGTPSQKDMPLLVKEFVQTAKRLNLSVASVKYDLPRRTGGEPAVLTFSFPVEGRYPDIKRFIFEVETSGRLVGIKNIKMSSDKGRVKLDLHVITYIKG